MSPNGHQILLLYSEKRKNPYVIGEKRSDAEFVIETTSSSSSILVEYGLHVIRGIWLSSDCSFKAIIIWI